jgi:membrane protein involved in colicin uptake
MGVLKKGAELTLKQIKKKIKNKKQAERKAMAEAKAKEYKNLSKEEKEALKYEESIDARTKAAEDVVKDQGTFYDNYNIYDDIKVNMNKGGRPKKIKKKSGGRLSDGTAFINSLYKDKM